MVNIRSDYPYQIIGGKIFHIIIQGRNFTMMPNKECMKAILKFVSENAKVKVDDMAFGKNVYPIFKGWFLQK